jgi:hypothetical protein
MAISAPLGTIFLGLVFTVLAGIPVFLATATYFADAKLELRDKRATRSVSSLCSAVS